MIDGDAFSFLFMADGKFRRWLTAVATFAALVVASTLIYSWLGG